ncbi:nitrile hydratase subunit beta [Sulfitobacter sp. KE34]|uniref:Nitrile hydratase subunit beta n=1 Tax=Sulfitobacter faviae TaxID=1775881 RepID=A0AAX3LLE8_9RHOB|nr:MULTISPECIES: nitrile hydratase subunit beta [Sulfitobacter]MDF3348998.1 nitrile hydratase subunit beta [Sulfitobacter sp. KE12]MDF3352669.1 nitrile hydratase subunit beta [Sulfitobacter sp. KE27]MDF3356316.1 nitrile hydratase subunit beta [Sulfitobacter sp. KE33]MDF3360744.1 nitrile hydratase subunit beta [Sulfitobacter sp. Ks41]MDF3363740.1 nitrile hydratase subunit beta [Sulfitobacter sp. Ks34]
MTRVHDMGGRFGDGAVVPEGEDVVFHADWHRRALALTLATGTLGKWNIDVSRHARECLAPTDYMRFSYYEKWIAGVADMLVARGVVSREELSGEAAPTPSPLAEKALKPPQVAGVLARGGPADRPSDITPLFSPGDRVVTRKQPENTIVPGGHTRLPAYAAGASGRVLRLHGAHVLPDSNAHDLGEAPEPLYAVAFPASELWAHPEHPRDEVVLDLWQSYLEAP